MKYSKKIAFSSLAFLIILSISSCNNLDSNKININSGWKFHLLSQTEKDADFHQTIFDDSAWETVSLPHTANIEPQIVNNQWQGICWYRKEFVIPANVKDKKVYLEFEAAMNFSKFWINGNLVESHHGGYLPVMIDATKYLVKGEKNTIAVRLDNTDNPTTGPKPLKILDFNMYGGLYRNAWLIIEDKVHISHPVLEDKTAGGGVFITTPKVSETTAEVQVKTHVLNENGSPRNIQVVNAVFFKDEKIAENTSTPKQLSAGSGVEVNESFEIDAPKLWSPQTPELYTMETKVMVDNKEVDSETTRFGIRSFEFKGTDFYLNGKKTFLRGVNRHQEYPFIGYALSDNAQYRDAKKIKDAGFDYIRLSHYPQSPAFMRACDELGLIVIDAILGWQFYKDTDSFKNYCYRSAKELIYRDRNHACVLGWEVSLNETAMPIPFMQELHKIVHEQYPGKNVYSSGWKPEVYDLYLQARQHRIMHQHDLPNKPYVVSEYGDWEYYSSNAGLNQHALSKEKRYETSSRQKRGYGEARLLQQAHNLQEAHNSNFETPAFADGYWVMFDYNRGYHNDIEYSGIMDIFRLPKFSYYFYQSQRPAEELGAMVKLATYWTEKSPLNVKVYSNADEVELFLNNASLGKQKPDSDSISTHINHPPFTFKLDEFVAGELKAVAYNNGQKVASDVVNTPGTPKNIKMWLDESGKAPTSACNDVLFLYIAATDETGTIIPDYQEAFELTLNGAIEVMNPNKIVAEAGIATALLRIGNKKGTVSVTAVADHLTENKIAIKVE